MKTTSLLAAMSLIALSASPALAGRQVSFNGSLEMTSTVELQGTTLIVNGKATVNGTQVGLYGMNFQEQVNVVTGASVGTMRFMGANGDEVWVIFVGQSVPTSDPNVLSLSETATIIDGEGRFIEAQGSFTTQRLLNLTTFDSSGSFTGVVSRPRRGQHR